MARERVQTRADADTLDALNEYADEADVSQSEAVRRMLRTGLTHHGHEIATADGMGSVTDRLDELEEQHRRTSLFHNATLLVGLAYVSLTVATGTGGLAWGLLGVGLLIVLTAATVLRNRPR